MHLHLRLTFAGYSIPQVADRWLAGLELSVFQKVTQKVWFVVLVGLLLGLAWALLSSMMARTWAIGLGFLVGAVWRIVGAMRRRGGSGVAMLAPSVR